MEYYCPPKLRFIRINGVFTWIVENQDQCNPYSCVIFPPVFYEAELIDRDGIVFKSMTPNVEGEGRRLRVTLRVNSSDLRKITEIKVTMV